MQDIKNYNTYKIKAIITEDELKPVLETFYLKCDYKEKIAVEMRR